MNVPPWLLIPYVLPVILGTVVLTDGVVSFVPTVNIPVDVLYIPIWLVAVIVPAVTVSVPLLPIALYEPFIVPALIVAVPVLWIAEYVSVAVLAIVDVPVFVIYSQYAH